MFISSYGRKALMRSLSLAGIIAGAVAFGASSASAGECPAGKMVAGGKGQQDQSMAAKDVTDNVLGMIALEDEPAAIADRQFRLRKLEVQPGGIVPWHSHEDRPAIIYIVAGEITEYSSDCAAPILHKAGETSVETHGVAHWWQNTGKHRAVLISADLLHDQMDADMM